MLEIENIIEEQKQYANIPKKKYFKKTPWTEYPNRMIKSNIPDIKCKTNQIETSKYNVLTFAPKNLYY